MNHYLQTKQNMKMKNIFRKLFVLSLVASVAFLYSCGEDEEPLPNAPALSVSAAVGSTGATLTDGGEIAATDSIIFEISGSTPGGFNVVRISGSGSVEITRNDLDLEAGETTLPEFAITFITDENDANSVLDFDFTLVDDSDQTDTVSFTINVGDVPFEDVRAFTTQLLGAQGNANPGFFNAVDGERYTYAQARDTEGGAAADFAYYFGATNQSTLSAIDDGGLNAVYTAVSLPIDGIFGTRNATRFLVTDLAPQDFIDIENTNELEDAAFFEVAGSSSITQLVEGNVIAFKLDDSRGGTFGLIHVASIDDTNGNGTITIDVKVP